MKRLLFLTMLACSFAGTAFGQAGGFSAPTTFTDNGSILASLLCLNGATSGQACIGVPAVAGTPAQINLPTATGAAGQVLSTNGASPQALSWATTATVLPSGVDTGVANAYVVNTTPAVTATLGTAINWTTTHPNTGVSTINVSGTGVKNLLNPAGAALVTGNIISGTQYSATYDGQEWVLGGFGTIPASPVSLPGTITLSSLDPASGFNTLNGAPLILLAKNPPATRQPLLAFGNAAGTSSGFFGFDNDNVWVYGAINTRIAFLSATNPEFFDRIDLLNNTTFAGFDMNIQPSLGGANKTSGGMLSVKSGDGNSGVQFDFRNHWTQIGNPMAGTVTFAAGTTASVTYATAFVSTPIVVFTPVNPGVVTFTMTASSNTGFTLTASVANSLTVNYVVIGNPN